MELGSRLGAENFSTKGENKGFWGFERSNCELVRIKTWSKLKLFWGVN